MQNFSEPTVLHETQFAYRMNPYARLTDIREWADKPGRFSEAERCALAPFFESDKFYEQGWDL